MNGARISVDLPGAPYEVIVERGCLVRIGAEVARAVGPHRVALICDDTVAKLYGVHVEDRLRDEGIGAVLMTVRPGEGTKTWESAGALLQCMSRDGLDRCDAVVALGGGVVGDLAGFCAGVYMRGVPVVQVPTTLLGQADSSLGGKTGVDLPAGKNLAGVFHQPSLVLSDPDVLASLPAEEWCSGMAEVVKSAVLAGEEAFAKLEADAGALAARDPMATERAVLMAASLKARVVASDERESGIRECLNLGHTLGHALEREMGYGVLTHGAAVAEGLRFAALLAEDILQAAPTWRWRQEALLAAVGLDRLGDLPSAALLLDAMRSDKKARHGSVRFVLADAAGSWSVHAVDDAVILSTLESHLSDELKGER